LRKTSTLSGSAEVGAVITIYGSRYDPLTFDFLGEVTLATTTVGTEGTWRKSIDLENYQGETVLIEVTATDTAGNESSRQLYGYFLYDRSSPKVTITTRTIDLPATQAGTTITGTIEFDGWELYTDITVSVSPATAALSWKYNEVTGDIDFTASISLVEGETTIVSITAMDAVGNWGSDYATVTRAVAPVEVEKPVPYGTYAIILVIIALILAAIAIFRKG
jgi:hypothetical protein